MTNKFERVVEFQPAFDKRDPNPTKNYGISSMRIRFLLKGEKGIIQFYVLTNLYLPEVSEEYKKLGKDLNMFGNFSGWLPMDIGYHSKEKMYDSQEEMDCDLLESKKCYYDGSTLRAETPMNILVREGTEGLWKFLEEEYKNVFGEN